MPANYGLLPQRRAFLLKLADLCRHHGTLLIFDEVITGFRVAFGGCVQQLDLQPDLVTWGKIIGGGFPVGAVAGPREYLEALAPLGKVYQAGTLSANPVAMTAGHATLEALLDGAAYARLEQLGQALEDALSVAETLRLQRVGSLCWLAAETGDPVRTPAAIARTQSERYARLFHAALAAGVYLPPSPVEVAFLSTAHTAEQVQALADLIRQHF